MCVYYACTRLRLSLELEVKLYWIKSDIMHRKHWLYDYILSEHPRATETKLRVNKLAELLWNGSFVLEICFHRGNNPKELNF